MNIAVFKKSVFTVIAATVVAAGTMTGAASVAQAGGYGHSNWGHGHGHGHGHGYSSHYKKCWYKTVVRYDHYGNPYYKRVKFCH